MAGIAGTEGLLVDIDTGTVRRDHVLVQHTPGALVFLGFGPRAERLRRFAFDDQGDAPFIARCRDVARAAETGRLVKARQAGISYAVLDIEDRVLRRFLIAESLAKAGYDPDEPRDDHGRWTSGGGGSAASPAAERPAADGASASAAGARPVAGAAAASTAVVGGAVRGLESLAGRSEALFDSLAPASTLSSLAAIGARLSAPAAFLSIILIPTNSNLAEDGTLPDRPDVSYHFDRDTGTLTFTQGGETLYSGHPDRDGLFLDKDGHPIGRELDGSLLLDSSALRGNISRSTADALAPAKTDRDEPEPCPAPSADRPGARDKDSKYQAQISKLVNPERPLKRGMAVRLPRIGLDHPPDPTNINDWVYFDDCRLTDGTMIEAKGTGYLDIKEKSKDDSYPWLGVERKPLKQAQSQRKAAGTRPVEWYFAEREIADHARNLFFDNKIPFKVFYVRSESE